MNLLSPAQQQECKNKDIQDDSNIYEGTEYNEEDGIDNTDSDSTITKDTNDYNDNNETDEPNVINNKTTQPLPSDVKPTSFTHEYLNTIGAL